MDHVSYWVELLMSGVVTGACYALIGAGLSLIWGTLKMVNLAHGEFYMLGAYLLWVSLTVGNMPLPIAIFVAVVGVLFFSAVVHMATIRPLLRKSGWDMSPWILTLGLQILLQNLALQIWGELYQNVPYFWDVVFKPAGLFTLSGQRIIIMLGAFLVIMALMIMIKYTKLGRAIVATSQDGEFAMMMGVNTKRVYLITYVISAGLAAIAGVLLCPVYSVNPWMGSTVQTKGLVVCILGGLGSVEGAIVAGILIGICESLTVSVIGSAWRDVVAYLLLIVILYARPTGLFGKRREG